MAKSSGTFPWALLLFWTGLILAADTVYAITSWRQHKAVEFTQVIGKIAQSALGQGALGRRGLRLRYTYTVNGANYTGYRYRYDDANVSVHYTTVLHEYPSHTRRMIYYNPSNPADSVLSPGVDGCDLLLLLVAAPFNVATFAVWTSFLSYRRKNRPRSETSGIKVLRRGRQVRIRMAEMSAFEAALYGLGVAAGTEASVVIATRGFDASMKLMGLVWAVAFLLAGVAWLWKFVNNRSGRYDLRLDLDSKTLTLPQAAARSGVLTVERDQLLGITVQRRVSAIPSGHHYSYLPALKLAPANAEPRVASLVYWGWSEARALAFGEWLGRELGAEFQGVQDELNPLDQKVPA